MEAKVKVKISSLLKSVNFSKFLETLNKNLKKNNALLIYGARKFNIIYVMK